MKITRYIYQGMLFPLLAFLLAGSVTGCSNDPTMEEEEAYGKTSLVVTFRSITTDSSQSTEYHDEYVETIRIVGFDVSGNLVCNGFYNNLEPVINQNSIEIIQELKKFQGGTCKLYFIANESSYTTYNDNNDISLTEFLNKKDLTEPQLKDCIIKAFKNTDNWTVNPILMTAQASTYIQSGKTKQNIGTIELVRCVAKIQLQIIDETGSAIISGTPTLSGTYPSSYSLWNIETYTNWTDENYLVNLTKKEDNKTSYTSEEIYFPERLFTKDNNETNALKFSFTLNDKNYTAAVTDQTGTDFNIHRNTHYTVIATLKKKENVEFNVLVNAWGEKTMDVPAFE